MPDTDGNNIWHRSSFKLSRTGLNQMRKTYLAAEGGNAGTTEQDDFILTPDQPVLVTGATGFIGARLVEYLLGRGCRNVRCFVRSSCEATNVESAFVPRHDTATVEIVRGNLLSRADCVAATKDVVVIFHLAAGRGEKSFPDAYANSVVTTRNLLDASLQHGCLRRFVNVSSFAVYSNNNKPQRRKLDESCPVETRPELRGEAYTFAKVKQDEIVREYGEKFGIPYVIVRPGYVIGPGKKAITGRVGIDTFGLFLHLGGSNPIPFTYVENCAAAIGLAGLKAGVDGEVFNVVDDDLPSSRRFLRLYKRNVGRFNSIYLPHFASYALCYLWERYSNWSKGQLPAAFNLQRWHANWKKVSYSNEKLKSKLGWSPNVPMAEGLRRYFDSCRDGQRYA
jgi:nucleoside-diphosphate-sugar epimerase